MYPLDDKSKWLYAVLRSLGHLPELWGYQAPSKGPDDSPAANDAQGGIKQENTSSADPVSPSDPSTNSPAGSQVPATVGRTSEPRRALAPAVAATPVPAGQKFPFYY